MCHPGYVVFGQRSNWIHRVLAVCFLVPKETKCNLKPGWAGWIAGWMNPSPTSLKIHTHTHTHSALKLLYITVLHTAAIKSPIGLEAGR